MIVPQIFYSARGTPLSAYHRIRDLVELGHEVEVLTYGPGAPPPALSIVVHRSRGPHFWKEIPQGPSYPKIWFDALLLVKLLGLLARRRYDLLYAHEEGGFIAALVAPLARRPLIYDMHSSLPLQIKDWKFSSRASVVRLFEWVERFTLARSVAAVAISPAVAEAARRARPGMPVEVIVNRFAQEARAGAAEGARVREELGLLPEHRVALYTGSFVALQALELLLEAVPGVLRQVSGARFVLVGGCDEDIARLEALARSLGVREAVSLLRARPQAEMPAFMAAADVLVSPRVFGINPPGKLFSYLDSGKPIVATDCPVHNQILDHECAILTAPDAESFAAGIVSALSDPERVRSLVAGAGRILESRYHPDRRQESYRRLLAHAGAP